MYRQPESGLTIKAENGDALIDLVVDHRKHRGFSPVEKDVVRKEVERQICVRLGREECRKEGPDDKWVPQDELREIVTISGVLGFSRAALAFIASGGELAPIEEVKRRAAICLACPLNQPMTGCACNTFYKVLDATIPRERKIEGLHVCRACNCSLSAKTNLTPEQVKISNKGRNIAWPAQECWQSEIMNGG